MVCVGDAPVCLFCMGKVLLALRYAVRVFYGEIGVELGFGVLGDDVGAEALEHALVDLVGRFGDKRLDVFPVCRLIGLVHEGERLFLTQARYAEQRRHVTGKECLVRSVTQVFGEELSGLFTTHGAKVNSSHGVPCPP